VLMPNLLVLVRWLAANRFFDPIQGSNPIQRLSGDR
jgi:hypothetical protein